MKRKHESASRMLAETPSSVPPPSSTRSGTRSHLPQPPSALAPTVVEWMPVPEQGAPMASAKPSDPLSAVGLAAGALVDRTYRVERVLGVGGMGVVAQAIDERLERAVAIKFIRPELFAFPEMRTFFLNEGRAMARVQHPNVLSIHAFGEHEGTPYFVMEFVPGQTVDQWLKSRQTQFPDLDEAVRIVEQACLGVQAIHAAKLVHRDLKPSNLLLDDTGRVAVADLGVARILESATNGNVIVGSSHYMAPEAALGEDENPETAARRDVYSLGCIAYELVTGRPPFLGQTDMNVLSQHVLEAALPPSTLRPGLPVGYDEVILHALAKEPLQRYASAVELRAALVAEHTGARDPDRILVADDDTDWREIIGTSLSARFPNAHIDYVDDGEEALHAFQKKPYSVVLVDLEMPTMDGAKLTMHLRELDMSQRTPIIVLTAAGGPKEWQRLSAIGADAFLVKPVNAEDVELVIRRTMRSRRSLVPSTPTPPTPKTG